MPNDTVLMTVHGDHARPSLAEAAAQLGVALSALDGDFGVQPAPGQPGEYVVAVKADALPDTPAAGESFRGPYSDPPIEGFGPPEE